MSITTDEGNEDGDEDDGGKDTVISELTRARVPSSESVTSTECLCGVWLLDAAAAVNGDDMEVAVNE